MTGDATSGRVEMVASYLSGRNIGLRAPALDDAESIATWDDGSLPRNPDAGREMLRRTEQTPWGNAENLRLMIVDLSVGNVVGSVMIERQQDRIGRIRIAAAPLLPADRRDAIEGEVLDLVVPWMRDELDLMVLVLDIASDRAAVLARPAEHGFREVVRLREHILRPHGRVDLLLRDRRNLGSCTVDEVRRQRRRASVKATLG
jgi:RimJ/RimL family protein N-acetyltransferase